MDGFEEGKYAYTWNYEEGRLFQKGLFNFIMTKVLPSITEDDIQNVYKVTTDYGPCDNICIEICSKALNEHWDKWHDFIHSDNDDKVLDEQRQNEINSLWKIGCFNGVIQIRKNDILIITDNRKCYGRNVHVVNAKKIAINDELYYTLTNQINSFKL